MRWNSEIEVVFIDKFQRTHLLTTKTRHLSVSEDTNGAEFYCDENSTLNHQCSHSRFLHIHILKTRSLTYNTRESIENVPSSLSNSVPECTESAYKRKTKMHSQATDQLNENCLCLKKN